MKILIIGAAGMIGMRLAKSITKDAFMGRINDITLFDVIPPKIESNKSSYKIKTGDISDPKIISDLISQKPDIIYNLAAIVSGEAEENFQKSWDINTKATWQLLEEIRKEFVASNGSYKPKFIYTSSLAVFSGPYPDTINDDFSPNPETSYGAQKLVGEILISEYSRKGYLDGIALRLPTIVVRPGKPNKAASSFYSSIIREPLNGFEAILPVPENLCHWFASPQSAVGFLKHAAKLDFKKLGNKRSLNLPGVSCSIADQILALEDIAGTKVSKLIKRIPDKKIENIVKNWPQNFIADRAIQLGFSADKNFKQIIKLYIDEEINT
ncbi:SDR family oxidoreductase [Amylibacter sp.]|nr:SDR family oxidoreductase [Amylibacter sp.]MDC0982727.1 SDR family oxidoreductase [Amylibacter sp.]